MIYKIRKIENEYYIYSNSDKILTPNKYPLKTKSLEHARILLREIKKKNNKTRSHSILSLTFFSINLSTIDKIEITKKLFKILQNDYILFRNFNDKLLINYMNKKFGTLIKDFSLEFNLPLRIQTDFTTNISYKNENFTSWLMNLENDKFTALYKLANISYSTVLSYFFIKKKLGVKDFLNW